MIALFASMLVLGLSIENSAKISNFAAGLAIGKIGTASVSFSELIK